MRYYVKASHKKVAHKKKKTPTQPTIQPKNKEAVHKYNTTENMKSNHFLFSEMSDSNMTCVTHKYYYY